MSLDACAALVEKGDPDRWQALLAAPHWARARLLPLYALNLEVARAPWVTREPMIAEMRLQWWREVLEEAATGQAEPPAHEVAGPLTQLLRATALPPAALDGMILARRHDAWGESFADLAAFEAYLEATGGGLMLASGLVLGAPLAAEAALRGYGKAAGLVAYLKAVPELTARGKSSLPNKDPAAIAALAREGLGWLQAARAARASLPRRAAPALLAGWQTGALLALAAEDPEAVTQGRLAQSEFARRGRLIWQSLSARW